MSHLNLANSVDLTNFVCFHSNSAFAHTTIYFCSQYSVNILSETNCHYCSFYKFSNNSLFLYEIKQDLSSVAVEGRNMHKGMDNKYHFLQFLLGRGAKFQVYLHNMEGCQMKFMSMFNLVNNVI